MILRSKCAKCNKPAEATKTSFIGGRTIYTLVCGHILIADKPIEAVTSDFVATDGKAEAYPFQQDGIKFLQGRNYNAMIADAMGLGKTIQYLLAYRSAYEKLSPCLMLVPSATIYQLYAEYSKWVSTEHIPCLVATGNGVIPQGFDTYICSHDMLARKGVAEKLIALGIKLVVIDEVHKFKDPEAKRTIALLKLIKESNIKHRILLSGTPIKNRAGEYFTALNLLDPLNFPSRKRFEYGWLVPNENGVPTRIAPWKLDRFKDLTSSYILRREKRDVLPDLPELQRNTLHCSIDDELLKMQYNEELAELAELLSSGKFTSIDGLGMLSKLRRLEGIAKVKFCIEQANEFLENTEDEKLTIGIHHEAVRTQLYYGLAKWNPLQLSGADSPMRKDWIVTEFQKPERRVLIANVIAGGTGLNLQFCSNAILLERQWSCADERQFEDRFHRNGQANKVVIDYLVASNWIDDYFSKLVESKRQIFSETIGDDSYSFAADTASIRDLAETLVSRGRV